MPKIKNIKNLSFSPINTKMSSELTMQQQRELYSQKFGVGYGSLTDIFRTDTVNKVYIVT